MIVDPKWLDALRLPVKVTVSVAVASAVLLVLDLWQFVDLDQVITHGRVITRIIAAVAAVFVFVEIFEVFVAAPFREGRKRRTLSARRLVKREEERERLAIKRSAVLASIDHLSAQEIHYVAECLHRGSPTFYTYAHSPAVAMLAGKGLVWTPGTPHNQDSYPFSFHDYVWDELSNRREALTAVDAANKEAARRSREAEARRR